MLFHSTRSTTNQQMVSLSDAVLKGLADDGGLFMPQSIGMLDAAVLQQFPEMSIQAIAAKMLTHLLGNEISEKKLQEICEQVFSFPFPLVEIEHNIYSLELFHGPTLAFKDVGARFMAAILSHFADTTSLKTKVIAATSGDTGSAVAAGFFDVPGVEVYILYPKGKVSDLQEKQLTTWGKNITAIEVEGTFDDCQKIAKQLLNDTELKKTDLITSANSINIARLLPQSVYYAYTWSRLQHIDKQLIFSVPSGNFGNLTAGLIAQKAGIPIQHFVASTNINDVVPNYLATGHFTARPSVSTISNAMDVGQPSNFERMLYLFGNAHEKMKQQITGFTFSDIETKKAIKDVYNTSHYILDPHGAVGYLGLKRYFEQNNLDSIGVFLETAHPAKFAETIESTLNQSIELPERLKVFASKKKKSIVCENNYEAVKQLVRE